MKRYLVALAIAGMVDAVSYMVVAPSIVFYVLENGGTKEQYGFILSAFSFASFCTKPFLGWWSDERGFRAPYISSLIVAALGGLLYLFASAFPPGRAAVGAILVSRLLGGVGAANSALGFAYVAKVVPHSGQTTTNTLLSAVRMTGLAAGPGVNALLGWVDVEVAGGKWKIDPLNVVGLVLVATNLLAMIIVFFLLDEPGDILEEEGEEKAEKKEVGDGSDSSPKENLTPISFLKAVVSAEILVPFLSIFTFNANFQLIETGFPPAANDALGWGPIETSAVLGSVSVVIVIMMVTVSILSSKVGVRDGTLVTTGHALSAMVYSSLYFLWKRDASSWHFWLPVMLSAAVFPIMAAPTRSFFTLSVASKPVLDGLQGRMQAYLSMGASVAGFVTPGLVARYCLRTSEEVDESSDGREMAPWALIAPVLNLITASGMIYVHAMGRDETMVEAVEKGGSARESLVEEEDGISMVVTPEADVAVTEATALLHGHANEPRRCSLNKYDPKIAAHRCSACSIMGLSQGTSIHEDEESK